jgi:hypothetical protein
MSASYVFWQNLDNFFFDGYPLFIITGSASSISAVPRIVVNEQLIANSVRFTAFAKGDTMQTMIDLRGFPTNPFDLRGFPANCMVQKPVMSLH